MTQHPISILHKAKLQSKSSGIPRRAILSECTPAEKAIYDATQAVEKMGADSGLTEAVTLLGRAQKKVADFVDGVGNTNKLFPGTVIDNTPKKNRTV